MRLGDTPAPPLSSLPQWAATRPLDATFISQLYGQAYTCLESIRRMRDSLIPVSGHLESALAAIDPIDVQRHFDRLRSWLHYLEHSADLIRWVDKARTLEAKAERNFHEGMAVLVWACADGHQLVRYPECYTKISGALTEAFDIMAQLVKHILDYSKFVTESPSYTCTDSSIDGGLSAWSSGHKAGLIEASQIARRLIDEHSAPLVRGNSEITKLLKQLVKHLENCIDSDQLNTTYCQS